jgi:hypothetical protein
MSPDVCEFVAKTGITSEALNKIFGDDVNPTKPFRFAQMVSAMKTTMLAHVDPGTARGLVALREAKTYGLNTDAIKSACLGKNVSAGIDAANMKGVSLMRINKLVPVSVGAGSVDAYVSRSFGKGGFVEMLGDVTVSGHRNAEVKLSEAPGPLVRAFFALLDGASEKELALMGSALGKKSKE